MPIPDLSPDDIAAIRHRFIKDLYVAAVPTVSPAVMLSHYNRAIKANYVSDTELQDKAYDVARAWDDELSGVYTDQYAKKVAAGLSTAAADVAALAIQKDAFFRLIRAACWEDMMQDPGFVGSVAEEARSALFKTWTVQIQKDRQFTRDRTTAPFRSVPLERF